MTLVEVSGELSGFLAGDRTNAAEFLNPTDLAELVTGIPKLDLKLTEASQLTFSISDENLAVLASGRLNIGTGLNYQNLTLEVAAVETTGGTGTPVLNVTARPAGIEALKRSTGPLVVSDLTPTQWGQRIATAVGLGFVGQPSANIGVIERKEATPGKLPDNDWDVLNNLANDLGYVCFEAANTIYFGKPSWLIARTDTPHWTIVYGTPGEGELAVHEVPAARRSSDAETPVTVDLVLSYADGIGVRPGDRVTLVGVPTFDTDYLVTSVPIDIDGISPITVSVATPIDPTPSNSGDALYSDNAAIDALAADYPSPGDIGGTGSEADRDWAWPTTGAVTGRFGDKRPGHLHKGVDLANVVGTHIYAAKGGRVIRAGAASGFGNLIVIDHGGGYETWYGHLSQIIAWVATARVSPPAGAEDFSARRAAAGDLADTTAETGRVSQGQLIGLMGGAPGAEGSGDSTGPHLHFEVHFNGIAVDPLKYLPVLPSKAILGGGAGVLS